MEDFSSNEQQTQLTLEQILAPNNEKTIDLDDMKSILSSLPFPMKQSVQKIFHDYILSSKSFQLPVSTFFSLYNRRNTEIQQEERNCTVGRSSLNTQTLHMAPNSKIAKYAKKLSIERCFIHYDNDFISDMKPSAPNTPSKRKPRRSTRSAKKETQVENKKPSASYLQIHNMHKAARSTSRRKRRMSRIIKL